MGGQKKTATESQTDTFQELVVLLVGSDVKFVVVPFQNLLGIGKDWGDEFLSCFHSMPINVSMPIYRDDVYKRQAINRFIWSLVRCGRLPFSPRLSWKRLYGFSLISPKRKASLT